MCDIKDDPQIIPLIQPVERLVNEAIDRKEKVILEGAQGTLLDIIYGTYPYVTSSNTISSGICMGGGIGPTKVDLTLGILKAYCTRVGHGPFPTEFEDQELDHTRLREIGTTTGRKRRIGWFDAVLGRYAVQMNGADALALMKLDILDDFETIKICTGYKAGGETLDMPPPNLDSVTPIYETLPGWMQSTKDIKSFDELPENAQKYIKRIQELCDTPVAFVSYGPEREKTLTLEDVWNPSS